MIHQKLGPYRIVEQVGEGGMGAVYRATDEMLGRDVAVKVLRPQLAHDAALVERFRQEARSLARISHPNVAALYGLFQEQDTLFMAMEFVPGETADAMIRRRGRLPWAEAGALMLDVLAGLDGAHRLGIIHRDLKPANLLISPSGAVKITDFGIARVLGTARYTRTGMLVGTLAYMAPEQVRGEEGDARSDVYAAAMVLYELLTGTVAFHRTSEYEMMRAVVEAPAQPPRERLSDVPEWLDAIVMKGLAKDPVDRFQSAADMLLAIQAQLPAADAADVGATRIAAAGAFVPQTRLHVDPANPPATAIAPAAQRRSQFRRIAAAVAAAIVILIAAFGWWRWANTPGPDGAPLPPPSKVAGTAAAPADVSVVPPVAIDPHPTDPRPPLVVKPPVERKPRPALLQPPSLPDAPIALPSEPVPVAPAPVATAPPPPTTPARADIVFDNVKMLRTRDGKTEEVDVLLTFAANRLVIAPKKPALASQAMTYRALGAAVYSQSKHPRWKEGSAAALAAGVFAAPIFFMKGTKHWLTLEGGSDAIVLRLDKNNYRAILPELEVRTGKKVDRGNAQPE